MGDASGRRRAQSHSWMLSCGRSPFNGRSFPFRIRNAVPDPRYPLLSLAEDHVDDAIENADPKVRQKSQSNGCEDPGSRIDAWRTS